MNTKKRTVEHAEQITVVLGQANFSTPRFTPPTGFVTRVVAHYNTIPNPGFVQIGLYGADGSEIIKPQSVRSLRSREVPYEDDGKIVNLDTAGKSFVAKINSTDNMTADFNMELIFIYEVDDNSCLN